MNYQNSYLLTIRFLGFRLHGWQKQPNLKTVHFIVDKTLKFVLNKARFKTVGVGRTDAKVSANSYPLQLFIDDELNLPLFIENFNQNSPADLQLLNVKTIIDSSFNIIQQKKIKEYHYHFSNQGKNHPFCAPFITGYSGLNTELMYQGSKLFEGTHHFGDYCSRPSEETKFIRTIESSEIVEIKHQQESFMPDISYIFKVRANGFLRYQVRLMMGALIEVGKGKKTIQEIEDSLKEKKHRNLIETIAPGSGLQLYSVEFEDEGKYFQ